MISNGLREKFGPEQFSRDVYNAFYHENDFVN